MLLRAVVQVAFDAPPLGIGGRDQSSTRRLQLGRLPAQLLGRVIRRQRIARRRREQRRARQPRQRPAQHHILRVQLAMHHAVAGHLRLQVARHREVVQTVVPRVGVEQRDRVGVLIHGPAGASLPRRVVGAEQQDRRRAGEEEAAIRR